MFCIIYGTSRMTKDDIIGMIHIKNAPADHSTESMWGIIGELFLYTGVGCEKMNDVINQSDYIEFAELAYFYNKTDYAKMNSEEFIENCTELRCANFYYGTEMLSVIPEGEDLSLGLVEFGGVEAQLLYIAHRLINKKHLSDLLIADEDPKSENRHLVLDDEMSMFVIPEHNKKFLAKITHLNFYNAWENGKEAYMNIIFNYNE